jgi:enoyl-[acyl-carrier protein] reductase III
MPQSAPRWALVLGSSSGFGAAICRSLAASGFHIFGVHLDRRATLPDAEQVAEDCRAAGVECVFYNSNAADERRRTTVLDDVQRRVEHGGGTVAVLVHSLAFGTLVPFVPMPDADGDSSIQPKQMAMTLDVMANSLVWWTQDLIDRGLLVDGGRIFAMTSSGARLVNPTYGAVSAAKAALEAHIRQLAYELLPRGITANAILAGVTRTPALLKIPDCDVLIGKSLAKSPVNRLTRPEDVGEAIAALTDPRLHWMTGNVIGVHGGEEVFG